jgi:putative restriction endonuclease
LEAAHIKWVQAGGPDRVTNGLCLCALHHTIFDLGAFTITLPNFRIVFSEDSHDTGQSQLTQVGLHGQHLRLPQAEKYYPTKEFLDWHMHEVFRRPPREM